MGIESITDQRIRELLTVSKRVTNPNVREIDKGSHRQKNYKVKGINGEKFSLYLRQSKLVEDDFSCGLSLQMVSGETLTLVRYNGSSHPHPNRLENTNVDFTCHIHTATERYISANLKPEGFAETTDRYSTLNGALHQLLTDCNITGLLSEPDQPDMFK